MSTDTIHRRSLATSTALSRYYLKHMITPLQVITTLNRAKISFVLVGLHGLSGWMKEPRATQDVDVIITARQVKKAVRVLVESFPNLEPNDLEAVVRLKDRRSQELLIDVLKPVEPLYRESFKYTFSVKEEDQVFRIPSVEMAIALKFAMIDGAKTEQANRYQAAHDFILMIKTNPDIKLDRLAALGDLVAKNGNRKLVELVRRVRAGEKLVL